VIEGDCQRKREREKKRKFTPMMSS
jgi:hypothetical protein